MADPLPETVRAGEVLDLAVHVVNDARAETGELQVRARVLGPDDAVVREQGWAGMAGPDACVMVGRLAVRVPAATRASTLAVELTLTGPHRPDGRPAPVVTNRYTTVIA